MSQRVNSGPVQPQGYGEDPLLFYTRLFVRFLQLVFATFEKGSYKWSADDNATDILITAETHITREVAEKNPAIIVTRGPVTFGNMSLDQFKAFDPITGKRTHSDITASSVNYNCISSQGLEAGRIAHIASYATRALKRSLMAAGIHRVGEELSIGPESPPGALIQGDPGESVVVSVNVPFYFPQTWTIEPIDKVLLKDLAIALTSEVDYPDKEAIINPPSINGRPITYSKLISLTQVVGTVKPPTPRK